MARKQDPLVEVEVGILGDTAVSLGRAGRKLRSAVTDFTRAAAHPEALDPSEHRAQLHAVARALWALVVQREAIGLTDHRSINQEYGVTAEIWRRVGVMVD